MLFTLEALKAAYGDALLLHFGDPGAPGLIIIDGGPRGVCDGVLTPRLEQLREQRGRLADGQLPVRLVVVSHLDDDHVNGILRLANGLAETTGQKPYRIESLWHNSFDDLLGPRGEELAASLELNLRAAGTSPGDALRIRDRASLVVASVRQGRDLRDAAQRLGWDINREFGGHLVHLPKEGVRRVPLAGGLTLTPLGPRAGEVETLNAEWDEKIGMMGGAADPVRAAEYADKSVYNLSSIILLAETPGADGRPLRMLLPGDARGDQIVAGLAAAGLLEEGKCHVDLLKLPHHGSSRNLEPAFFATVTADHYVISSNGEKFDNPDQETLAWLAAARRGTGHFTVYLTYPVAEFRFRTRTTIRQELQAFIDAGRESGAYSVICREPEAPSVRIDLGEPLQE